jgi:hypothetical protein
MATAPPPAPVAAPAAPVEEMSSMAKVQLGLEAMARPLGEKSTIPKSPRAQMDAKAKEAQEKQAQPAPKVDETRPGDTGMEEAEETPATDEAAPKAEETKPGERSKIPPNPKQLRDELARVKKERDDIRRERDELKSKPPEDPEKPIIREKLTAAEKRLQDYEDRLRYTDYQQSEEYKTKWEKPFYDAYNMGRETAAELEIVERIDPDTGEVIQPKRPATPADFDRVAQILNKGEATRLAKQMFGDDYVNVMHHYNQVHGANKQRMNALEEFRKTGAERTKQMQEQSTAQRMASMKAFDEGVKKRVEKVEYLKEVEGDQAWNEALKRGQDIADKAFKKRHEMKPGEAEDIDAQIYAKASAYHTLNLKAKRLTTRVAELEKELAEYKKSEPGPGEAADRGNAPASGGTAMDDVFANLERKAKPRGT